MPNTFFTSDSHFGHKGILKVSMARPRPFATIEEHDEALVRAWNAVVRPTDIVWHLGDFAYKCQVGYAASVRARLNGRIRLIRGNHDHGLGERLEWDGPVVDVQWVFVQNPGMPKPQAFWCSHYAHRIFPNSWYGDLHLYGHSHGTLPGTRTSLDVGVNCWDWAPVSLPDILRRMAETPEAPACFPMAGLPDEVSRRTRGRPQTTDPQGTCPTNPKGWGRRRRDQSNASRIGTETKGRSRTAVTPRYRPPACACDSARRPRSRTASRT